MKRRYLRRPARQLAGLTVTTFQHAYDDLMSVRTKDWGDDSAPIFCAKGYTSSTFEEVFEKMRPRDADGNPLPIPVHTLMQGSDGGWFWYPPLGVAPGMMHWPMEVDDFDG